MISYEKQENAHPGKKPAGIPSYSTPGSLPSIFDQSFFLPCSAPPAQQHADCTAAFICCQTDISTHYCQMQLYPQQIRSSLLHKNIKTAPRITGNTASPLVFSAFPYTRFVTRPASRAMSINISFCTSSTILLSCVKKEIRTGALTANRNSVPIASTAPIAADFFVCLSHISYFPAPMYHPVIMAFACASALPTQKDKL